MDQQKYLGNLTRQDMVEMGIDGMSFLGKSPVCFVLRYERDLMFICLQLAKWRFLSFDDVLCFVDARACQGVYFQMDVLSY